MHTYISGRAGSKFLGIPCFSINSYLHCQGDYNIHFLANIDTSLVIKSDQHSLHLNFQKTPHTHTHTYMCVQIYKIINLYLQLLMQTLLRPYYVGPNSERGGAVEKNKKKAPKNKTQYEIEIPRGRGQEVLQNSHGSTSPFKIQLILTSEF